MELPYLKELELNENMVYRKPGYRIAVIRKLPGLIYLDKKVINCLFRKLVKMKGCHILKEMFLKFTQDSNPLL